MSIEQDIYTEIQQLLSQYRQTLSVDTSDLLTLDRAGAGDAALTRWHEAGQSCYRAGLVPGSDHWRLQRSPNGAEQGYQDVLTVDRATGEVAVLGGLSAGAIDGVPIGYTTPATGRFTYLDVSGVSPTLTLSETDDGAQHRLVSSGGVLYVQADGAGGASNDGRLFLTGRLGEDLTDLRVKTSAFLVEGEGRSRLLVDDDGVKASNLYSGEVVIPNDTSASIPTPSNSGVIFVTNQPNHDYPQPDYAGFAMFDAGLTPGLIKLSGGARFYIMNSDVSGTTGQTPGVTVGVVAGALKIENRYGGAMTFRYTIIG